MSSIKFPFLKGFQKTAGLPQWLHDSCKAMSQNKPPLKGHSKRGLKDMMKHRGIK